MPTAELLAFAQARDALGLPRQIVAYTPQENARELLARVAPGVNINHWRVALDHQYAEWDTPLGEVREIAIIPPVSGG